MPTALITGVTGQDGSYLSELLLSKGYEVHGSTRSTSTLERSSLAALIRDSEIYNKRLFVHRAELNDSATMREVLGKAAPDEVYHFAAQSHLKAFLHTAVFHAGINLVGWTLLWMSSS